ncbi:MAG: hypothetical protein Q8L37_06700 [Candidatus Gottesmanbacteria bacterium]|nr:hypothetical protein [Candidatus Gottesmanbacteria bacterium]
MSYFTAGDYHRIRNGHERAQAKRGHHSVVMNELFRHGDAIPRWLDIPQFATPDRIAEYMETLTPEGQLKTAQHLASRETRGPEK